MSDQRHNVTRLLASASQGDREAQQEVFLRVEFELRKIARKYLRTERPSHTLQPTVLVDEAFMRLVVDSDNIHWNDRAHFYRAAARAMRRLLVDHERQRRRKKRGGGQHERVDLDLSQLVEDKAYEFFFAWAPLKIKGATGSPGNPIAIY